MPSKPHRTFKYYYLRFVRLKGDPRPLARGVAIGVFVGLTPTIPFHTVSTLFLAVIFRAAKIPALLASVIIFPLNPLSYYLSWRFGNWLTPWDLSWERIRVVKDTIISGAGFMESISALGKLSQEALIVMLLGGLVFATPFAIFSYFLSHNFFVVIQQKRLKKQILE